MNILVGFDGSNAAREALRVAQRYAKAFGAEVTVVASVMVGTKAHGFHFTEGQNAEDALRYAEKALEEGGVVSRTCLLNRGLPPGEDLVTYARENDVDLIVLGVRRRSKVGKLLMGSTAQYVILKSDCPVLTVK